MRHMLSSFAAVLAMLGQSAAQAEGSAPSLTGAWSGTYVCAQGRTGLTLTIDRQSGATFSGYFHFYPPRDNPAAREGCFSVNGDVDASGNVSVKAGRWITQPDGYVTVDLGGTPAESLGQDIGDPLKRRGQRLELRLGLEIGQRQQFLVGDEQRFGIQQIGRAHV